MSRTSDFLDKHHVLSPGDWDPAKEALTAAGRRRNRELVEHFIRASRGRGEHNQYPPAHAADHLRAPAGKRVPWHCPVCGKPPSLCPHPAPDKP